MDFGFGEEQELLRDTTRRFLAEHQPVAAVRARMEVPTSSTLDLAPGADLGWTAMLVPAEYRVGA